MLYFEKHIKMFYFHVFYFIWQKNCALFQSKIGGRGEGGVFMCFFASVF